MKSNLNKIDHVVVLMLENRSFDNMLGWLRHSDRGKQKVNGVAGKDLSNPIPEYARPEDGTASIHVGEGKVTTSPNPDPGEEYAHVNTQLFGQFIPDKNRHLESKKVKKPYNLPARLPEAAPMNGFVADYINHLYNMEKNKTRSIPKYDEYKIIMDCFPETILPVMSKLAKEYAVFDAWFASVPSQTLCNRSFMHTATSHGFVLNSPITRWMQHRSPTVFDRIEEKQDPKVTWKVYFDKLDIISLTGLQNPTLWRDRNTNFQHMDDFFRDASAPNGLPSYSFIEPRFLIDHNDQHPPVGEILFEPPSVLGGEILIEKVYHAVRNGPNWEKTLLIITFDEHGGCYDHVPPPKAVPPDPKAPKGEQDFKFDRLGVRVPTIMISPYIKAGTVISDVHDHTSIIKFISDRWKLDPLTERDKNATNFHNVLNSKEPRTDRVKLHHHHYQSSRKSRNAPLNDLQKIILMLAIALDDWLAQHQKQSMVGEMWQFIVDESSIAHIKTIGQAIDFTLAYDRRVTKRLTFFEWLWMKIRHTVGILQ